MQMIVVIDGAMLQSQVIEVSNGALLFVLIVSSIVSKGESVRDSALEAEDTCTD